jgi:hypothetical protein
MYCLKEKEISMNMNTERWGMLGEFAKKGDEDAYCLLA